MEIRNGIAYSGSKEECGTLEEKLQNAKDKNIGFIQVRAKDIQDLLVANDGIDRAQLANLINLVKSYRGEISVHLPNPVWDYSTLDLSNKNQVVISTIRDILVPLGIKKYTIHPHFNRAIYETLSPDEKKKVLLTMGNYFADLVLAGASLAIENIPVRDLDEIQEMPESPKKQKAIKNISYGMTMEEIARILGITRKYVEARTGDTQLANDRVGITYDTGHSLTRIDNQQAKRAEVERWIQFFKDDIMIYHITPSIERNSDGSDSVKEEGSRQIIKWVYEFTKKYNIDALSFVEAHGSLKSMSRLYEISCELLGKSYPKGIPTDTFPSAPSDR